MGTGSTVRARELEIGENDRVDFAKEETTGGERERERTQEVRRGEDERVK